MTDIKFFKKDGIFVGFECSGHTGFDINGKDILCATISGLTQSIVLGLKDVCKINIKFKRQERSGYILVELPKNINDNQLDKSQVLFKTLYLSIKDLCEGYSNYISMEVIEYVY